MHYLYNKVYLSLDNAFEYGTDCVLISPLVSTFPTSEFERKVSEFDLGNIHLQAETFEALPGDLINAISDIDADTKVIIYASADAYVEILSKWFKTMLPSLEASDAYELMLLALVRIKHTYGYPYASHKYLTPTQADQYKNLLYSLPDREVFEAGWDMVEPFDVSANGYKHYAESSGIEFLLASYFANAKTPYKKVLEARVERLVRASMVDFMADQFNRAVRRPSILPGYDVDKQTVDEWANDNPKYAVLADREFSSSNLDHVLNTYDLKKLGQVYVEVLGWLGLSLKADFKIVELWTKASKLLDAVIAIENDNPQFQTVLAVGRRSSVVNTYVLNRLLAENRAGSNELAKKLTLAS